MALDIDAFAGPHVRPQCVMDCSAVRNAFADEKTMRAAPPTVRERFPGCASRALSGGWLGFPESGLAGDSARAASCAGRSSFLVCFEMGWRDGTRMAA